jgi:GntR family transcriptional regulator, N-acetylglucosamine utilization regulator
MILNQGPTPLYYQIKSILKSQILSNEFKENQRFPSETELCVQYNVSRATVRQALSEMVREGLIYRDKGRGSFVTDGVGLRRLSLKGTIENLIAAGEGSRIKVAEYRQIHPPPNIAKIFKLGMKEKVYQLGLVRSIPKGIFAYSFVYFPTSLGKIIFPEEMNETTEIITFVEGKLKTRAHRANQTIDIGFADKMLAKNLFIKPKTPLLIIERDYYGRDGVPLFASITYCRPDLYKYRIELTRT